MTSHDRLPMFPLSTVLFPGTRIPLHVFEPRYQALVHDCLTGDGRLGIVLIARGSEVGGGDERFDVGTLARLDAARPLGDGRWYVEAAGVDRIRIVEWLDDRPYPTATVEAWPATAVPTRPELVDEAEAAVGRAWALLSELSDSPTASGVRRHEDDARPDAVLGFEAASKAASEAQTEARTEARVWGLCATAPVGPFDRQRLLAVPGADERMKELIDLVDAVARDARALLGGA